MLISPEAIEQAKKTDLLTYLQEKEPNNLIKVSGNTYCTKEHDSLKISNGKWHWFSQGIGGASALDYLIKVEGIRFLDAVAMIVGPTDEAISRTNTFSSAKQAKRLLIPKLAAEPDIARRYLMSRGIHPEIIDYCIQNSLVFETERTYSVLFVGYDPQGIARYASVRGINSPYKGELTGSDKHFSFCIPGEVGNGHVHLFEAAIDLMSYATIQMQKGRDWRRHDMLSLAGVFQNKRQNVLPIALQQYLKDHPGIKTLHLHLDNDEVGRGASIGIIRGLPDGYTIIDEPPIPGCKDINDELRRRLRNKEVDAR